MPGRLKKRAERLNRDVYALYVASRHPGVPRISKFIIAGVVAYLLSPIDLIPDFIPVLGVLDDIILLPLGVALAIRTIPADVWRECRERSAAELAGELPRNRKAAVVVVAVWCALASLILVAVLRGLP
jgi:uncharacterized membrane protein YkvA (DUF1232 family)